MKTDSSSLQDLIAIAKSPSFEDRRLLLDNIISEFLSRNYTLTQAQIDTFGDIVFLLLSSCPPDIQEQVAIKLAPARNAPRNLVLQLAHSDYHIARHLLEYSQVLDENDLILIAENSSQEHIKSIARRPNLGMRVQIVILQRGDQSAVDELTMTLQNETNTSRILKLRASNGFNFECSEDSEDKRSA